MSSHRIFVSCQSFSKVAQSSLLDSDEKVVDLQAQFMQDWEAKLSPTREEDARLRTVTKDILAEPFLSRHKTVEGKADSLVATLDGMKDLMTELNCSTAFDRALSADLQARRYLAAVAIVGVTVVRESRFKKGKDTLAGLKKYAEYTKQAVIDLKMWQKCKEHPIVVPDDLRQELEAVIHRSE